MMKSASLLLGISFCFQTCFADTITAPFNLELSNQSARALLNGIDQFQTPVGEYKTDLPDQTITNTEYPVTISGIHLTLDYTFNPPVEAAALNEYSITSKNISAEVVVDKVDASQTIVETSNGNTLTLHVNATCTNVHLQLISGATTMSGTVALTLANHQANFVLTDFSASWTPAAWQITSLNCQGPTGFTQLVQQQATTQLESINPFLTGIQNQIQSTLNSVAPNPISWNLFADAASGISVNLKPDALTVLKDNSALFNGSVDFNFSKLKNTACQNQALGTAATPETTDSLTFPLSVVQNLIKCVYLNGSASVSFQSSAFSGFKDLLEDPPLKLLVWPNLLKFNSKNIFDMTLAATETPTFGDVSAGKNNDFSFDMEAPASNGTKVVTFRWNRAAIYQPRKFGFGATGQT
jgi:hypothetical protein